MTEEEANSAQPEEEEQNLEGKNLDPLLPGNDMFALTTSQTSTLSDASQKTNKSSKSSKTSKSSKSPNSRLSNSKKELNEEVLAAMDLLEGGKDPSEFDPETLGSCIEGFKTKKENAVKEGDYLKANEYAELMKSCQRSLNVGSFATQCTQKLDYYRQKQADAQELLDQINQEWEDKFYEFEAQFDMKLQELTNAQKEELDTFNNSTPDDLPPQYQKFSPDLLLMRKRERLLLRNEEYVDAHKMKTLADQREALELTQQQSKFQDDRLKKQNALIDKHNQQFLAFAEWVKERRHVMLQQRDKDTEGPRKRLQHYTELVEKIEKKGIAPNPTDGFTINKVSRKESVKACRTAAQTPLERSEKRKPREKPPIPTFRPSSVISSQATRTQVNSSLSSNKTK